MAKALVEVLDAAVRPAKMRRRALVRTEPMGIARRAMERERPAGFQGGSSSALATVSVPAASPTSLDPWLSRVAKTNWPTRRRPSRTKPVVGRAERELRERAGLIAKFIQVLKRLDFPVVADIQSSGGSDCDLEALAGGLRAGSLRNRLGSWRQLARWLTTVRSVIWPASVWELLSFLRDKADGGCGASSLRSVVAAVRFFETAGNVRLEHRLTKHPALESSFKDFVFTRVEAHTGPAASCFVRE